MNITIKFARLPNGLVYFYQHWLPENPKALIIFVHGLGDHIGRLGDFVSHLTKRGYACALYDARGHGRSEGRRGHVDRFSGWVDDLSSFVAFSRMSVPEGAPLFLIGGSLGALVGINYLISCASPVAGMVSISAAIRPTVRIPGWKRKAAGRIVKFLPQLPIDNGIRMEDLTRDETELAALKADPFFHHKVTLGAGREIERNLELVMAMPHRIHVPMLMLAGGDDSVCDPDGTKQFAIRLSSPDKAHHIYPGMAHDLLHDIGRLTVMDDIEQWIAERARIAAPAERQFPLEGRESLWENVSPAC